MAQVTVYLPDDLERELRRRARRAGRSLSSLVADLARAQLHPQGWPEAFADLFGAWEGGFPVPEDAPPRDVTLGGHGRPVTRRRR